jgi:hypothetical protein
MTRFFLGCVMALLAGCGALPWTTVQVDNYWLKPGAPQPGSRVESLLDYAEYARALSGVESAKEHERMRQAFAAANRSNFLRIQYALLLAVSAPPARDLGRARQLLEPALKEDGVDADLRRMAAYLHAGIGELLDVDRRYREEQRRSNSLEQKLEALKSIEQRIMQRTAPEIKR